MHDRKFDAARRERMPAAGRIDVLPAVIADLKRRDAVGRKKYGTTLQSHNGRDALVDAYQEALDLAMYLRQAILERDDECISGHENHQEQMKLSREPAT